MGRSKMKYSTFRHQGAAANRREQKLAAEGEFTDLRRRIRDVTWRCGRYMTEMSAVLHRAADGLHCTSCAFVSCTFPRQVRRTERSAPADSCSVHSAERGIMRNVEPWFLYLFPLTSDKVRKTCFDCCAAPPAWHLFTLALKWTKYVDLKVILYSLCLLIIIMLCKCWVKPAI